MRIKPMRVKLDDGAYEPVRGHSTDAGLDIRSRETKTIYPHSSEVFHTGVHIELYEHTAGLLVSKSGLNTLNDITSTGLIDEGYDGEIVVKLYNHGDTHYKVRAGDKISQLVVVPVCYPEIEIVDEIEGGERGDNGFGSTGR